MGTERRYALAIDLGTGGPKAAVVAEDGTVAARAARTVRTRFEPGVGAEQEPEEVWRAALDAARQVVAQASPPAGSVAAVICSAQFSSIVGVDRAGHPATPLLLWMSRRGERRSREILERRPEALGTWLERHGAVPLGPDSLSHMLYVRHEMPDAYSRIATFLEPVDFLNLRLTGRAAATACTAFLMLLTDGRDPGTTRWDPDLVALSGLDAAKLPELAPVDARIGSLLPEVAAELGLPPGTPVLAGVNDTQAVTLGTGTFRPGRGGINVGTTMQVLAAAPGKKTDLEAQIVAMPSPLGGYLTMAEMGLGGRVLEHFLREVVHARDPLGDAAPADPFAGLDDAVASAPPGSGGVLFLPWLAGAQAPREDANARGAFLNLSLGTSRSRLARAVLEGLALQLRWMLPAVERFAGAEFAELTFSGGGARSDAWARILADATGRPILQLADPQQANTRGVALLAFVRLGLASPQDVERFRPIRRTYEPAAETHSRYEDLFARFVEAYEALAPLYARWNGARADDGPEGG